MNPRICALTALVAIVLVAGLSMIVFGNPNQWLLCKADAASMACDCQKRVCPERPVLAPWNRCSPDGKCCPPKPREEVNVNVSTPYQPPAAVPIAAVPKPAGFPYGLLAVVCGLALLLSAPIAFALRMRAATPNT